MKWVQLKLTCVPSVPFPHVYPRGMKMFPYRILYTNVPNIIAEKWKQTSIRQINKRFYVHIMAYYAATKRNPVI